MIRPNIVNHPSTRPAQNPTFGRIVQIALAAAGSFVLSCASASAFVGRGGEVRPGAGLSAPAQTKIQQSIEAQLAASPKLADRPVNALATDCLFAAEMAQRGDKRFATYLDARVKAILAAATPSGNAAPTWSRRPEDNDAKRCPNGGLDAFGDGTCDPPGTPYAFQSGLAIACLARAGEILKKADYAEKGKEAMDYWTGRASSPPECQGCIYYWSSGNAKDKDRYVRNTSLYLTLGSAALAHAGAMSRSLVARGVATEQFERTAGNKGYLSALDPVWRTKPAERERIENHMSSMASILLAIHYLQGDPAALDLARWNYAVWAGCNNKACNTTPCSFWAADPGRCTTTHTFTHCAFRQLDRKAREACEAVVASVPSLNSSALLLTIQGD